MKSNLKISNIAKSYLNNDPLEWYTFVRNIGEKISSLSEIQVADQYVKAPILKNKALIQSIILEEFMNPDFVNLIAYNNRNTIEIISDEIEARLNNIEIPLNIGLWEEVVDVSDGYIVTPLDSQDVLHNPLEIAYGYNTFKAFTISCDYELLPSIIQKALSVDQQDNQEKTSFLSLNLIDEALYKVLLSNPELLKTLNWRTFERLLEDILNSLGYIVELQQGTKDGGIDLIAIKKNDILGDHRYLLQAKRYKNKVGVAPVRELIFLHTYYKATKSCLASTANFTRGAWKLAEQYKWQLELRDSVGLIAWLKLASKAKGIIW